MIQFQTSAKHCLQTGIIRLTLFQPWDQLSWEDSKAKIQFYPTCKDLHVCVPIKTHKVESYTLLSIEIVFKNKLYEFFCQQFLFHFWELYPKTFKHWHWCYIHTSQSTMVLAKMRKINTRKSCTVVLQSKQDIVALYIDTEPCTVTKRFFNPLTATAFMKSIVCTL